MLVLGSKTVTVEGVTVYADHADPNQFWYLPAPVSLAERDGVPQFTLIRFRPAVASAGVEGGGFLMMEVELRLDPDVERQIRQAVSRFSEGTPRLTPVPFDDGTVQVIALNLQGSGGTNAAPAAPGTFVAVESILGATRPSLGGNNTAVFSLTLSQEGSIILDQAFREGATPVGVIYDLKYTALRPSLDVTIKANFKRVYDSLKFSVDLTAGGVIGGVPVFLEAGIDMAFEKLKQDGVISVEVHNFSNAADEAEKEKWALDFFKQNLLQQWFQPTLAPVTFDRRPIGQGGAAGGSGAAGGGGVGSTLGSAAGTALGNVLTGGGAAGGAGASGSGASGSGASGGAASGGAASGGAASGGAASGGAAGGGEMPHESALITKGPTREVWALPFLETGGRQSARFERRVEPETAGYDVQLTQSAENDQVMLTFLGGTEPPTVRINGSTQTLSAQREVRLNVPGGSTMSVEADYPASPATPQEFRLYFDFDKPRAPGWSSNSASPSSAYSGYLANRTNPLDSRFETSTGQLNGASPGSSTGANALRAWLRNAVGAPRRVTVEGHASYEGDDTDATLNRDLSQRRVDVAVGIIGTEAQVTSSSPMGFTVARTAGRMNNPEDRYALIRGASAGGQAVSIRGTLSRPAVSTGGGAGTGTGPGTGTGTTGTGTGTTGTGTGTGTTGTGTGTTGTGTGTGTTGTGTGTGPTGTTGTGTGTGAGGAGASPIPQKPPTGIKLAFRLQKIEQIEDKTLELRYTRQSAEQRRYAPQGLIGLLADDLEGPPHFIEVDLDSPFFRVIDVEVEAPVVFDQIGLMKADVAIEYGRATDPVGIKHKDISFRPGGSRTEKASFFLNPKRDLNYGLTLQYHFNPMSGWDGEKLSYELPTVSSLDRTLLVNPFRDFGFFEIRVVPGDLDPDMVDSTDVYLHYEHPGRWSRDKIITVRPGGPEQSWKLRLSNPEQRTFSYRWVHRLKDGTTRETEPVSTNIPLVTVNDPYEEPLIIEFYPNFDASWMRFLLVDVTYEDPSSPRKRVQQIKFEPADPSSRRVRFARSDPSVAAYTIQLTTLGTDNSVRRLSPVRLDTKTVFLGEHLGI